MRAPMQLDRWDCVGGAYLAPLLEEYVITCLSTEYLLKYCSTLGRSERRNQRAVS